MTLVLLLIGIIVVVYQTFSGKRQIMLGEAKRGRVWPENVVRTFEYWLYCDTKNLSSDHLIQSISEIMDLDRDDAFRWMVNNSDNYVYYVDTIHPNIDPAIIDQSRTPNTSRN